MERKIQQQRLQQKCATANLDTKAWPVEYRRVTLHAVSTESAGKIQINHTPGASATRDGVKMAV